MTRLCLQPVRVLPRFSHSSLTISAAQVHEPGKEVAGPRSCCWRRQSQDRPRPRLAPEPQSGTITFIYNCLRGRQGQQRNSHVSRGWTNPLTLG